MSLRFTRLPQRIPKSAVVLTGVTNHSNSGSSASNITSSGSTGANLSGVSGFLLWTRSESGGFRRDLT
jgi:hypothetical protein